MKWFKHDTTATTDSKIKKLILRHGAIGYAVYFHCLELIAGDITDTKVTFELEHDSEIIADNLKIRSDGARSGAVIVEDIMRTIIELGLFEENNGHVFCFKMLKRMDTSMTSNKSMRTLIAKAKNQSSQAAIETKDCNESCEHDTIMTESCDIMLEEKRREENRLEKTRKDEIRVEREREEEGEEIKYISPQRNDESNFSASGCVQSECLDEQRKTYVELHKKWVQAGLPLSKSSANDYFTFSCRELKSALGEWLGMKLAPDDYTTALDNYIELARLIKSKGSWMKSVGGFDYFAKHILDFLDGNFDLDKYRSGDSEEKEKPKELTYEERLERTKKLMEKYGIKESGDR